MKGIVLAAGFGTRLRPLTYTIPKPVVPLCNRPLIGWAVESYLAAGVDEIIVNLHHLPAAIEQYLSAEYGTRALFHFSHEEEILGTGGAIRRVRPLLEGERDFFLVNGDTVQFPRYAELRDARRESDSIAALTLRHPPQGDRFTAVWHEQGRVTGFGKGTGEPLMFAGSHCLSSHVLEHLPDRHFSGIVADVYERLLQDRSDTIAAVIDDGLWFDIGTPQRYFGASSVLLEAMVRGDVPAPSGSRVRGDSLVHSTATTPRSLSRSTVGARSIVQGDVQDSIVWEDCVISGSARLTSCIVAKGVSISGAVELRNALICRDDLEIPHDAGYERRQGFVIARI